MYCTNCGKKLTKEEFYCTNCGNKNNDENHLNQKQSNFNNKNGNISFILGIIALAFFWMPIISIPIAIISFILGFRYHKETGLKSLGPILSIISFILTIIIIFLMIIAITFIFEHVDNYLYDSDIFYDFFNEFNPNEKDKETFDISGYSWKGDDESILYLEDNQNYHWYQNDNHHHDNFHSGIYEVYTGEDAIQYISTNLKQYGLTVEEQKKLFDNEKYQLQNYYLLILNCNKTIMNGTTKNTNNYLYYYGFYDSNRTYLELFNMDTKNKAGFTLNKKIQNNIDI